MNLQLCVKPSPAHLAKHQWFETFGSQCGDCGDELTMCCAPASEWTPTPCRTSRTPAPGFSQANACKDGTVRCSGCTRRWAAAL